MDNTIIFNNYLFDYIINYFQTTLIATIFALVLIAGIFSSLLYILYKHKKRIKNKLLYRFINSYNLHKIAENIFVHFDNDLTFSQHEDFNYGFESNDHQHFKKRYILISKIITKLQFVSLLFSNKFYFKFKTL